MFRAQVLLLWLSRAAGLHIDTRTCRWLRVCQPPQALLAQLGQLPVGIVQDGQDVKVFGLTPRIISEYLVDTGWGGTARTPESAASCHCSLKTAMVVANRRSQWQRALQDAPFGSSEVRESWPYLGVTVAGPTPDAPTLHWTQPATTVVRQGTWAKASQKMQRKAATLAACTCSQGRRAAVWNSHLASLIPYPPTHTWRCPRSTSNAHSSGT